MERSLSSSGREGPASPRGLEDVRPQDPHRRSRSVGSALGDLAGDDQVRDVHGRDGRREIDADVVIGGREEIQVFSQVGGDPLLQGNLCIGGKIGRFVSQVQDSGSTGAFSIPVDLDGLPVWRNQAAQPGETWYFQAWFKDGSFSNFTDGLEVTFL